MRLLPFLLILLAGCGYKGGDTVIVTWDNSYEREDGSTLYPYELDQCELEFVIFIPEADIVRSGVQVDKDYFYKNAVTRTACVDEMFVIKNVLPGFYEWMWLRARASDIAGNWSEWTQWVSAYDMGA